jgi:hypothetical protein
MTEIITFRDSIRNITPRWLRAFWGYRYLYAIGVHLDALGDSVKFGVAARFPNVVPEVASEALPLTGRERGITRGFDETNEAYAIRLERWLDDHRTEANPYTLLRQLQGYLSPHLVPMRVVNNTGAWYSLAADGTPSYHFGGNWNWDNTATSWSRFWVIIYPPADLWVADGPWDGSRGLWVPDGTVWGCNATVGQAAAVRGIIEQWRGPHSRCVNIIVAFDPSKFDPAASSPPLPNGNWGGYWDAPSQTASREKSATYWKGT